MLTVKQLKEFLSQFPDDMVITENRYSDMRLMNLEDWGTEEGVIRERRDYVEFISKEKAEFYLKQYSNNPDRLVQLGLHDYNPKLVKKFVFFNGN